MRRLAGYIDPSDVLYALGVVLIAVTVYVLWDVWVCAFVGAALIVVAVLHDIGQVERERERNGPRR